VKTWAISVAGDFFSGALATAIRLHVLHQRRGPAFYRKRSAHGLLEKRASRTLPITLHIPALLTAALL
jgi:hypothetical protein